MIGTEFVRWVKMYVFGRHIIMLPSINAIPTRYVPRHDLEKDARERAAYQHNLDLLNRHVDQIVDRQTARTFTDAYGRISTVDDSAIAGVDPGRADLH